MTTDSKRPAWVTDEVLAEAEDGFLAELVERLIAGGRDTGLTLEAHECRVLAELVVKRPKRKRAVGRPRSDRRLSMMLFYCMHLVERNGAPVEAAVTATAKAFSCSRATVFAVLSK